MQLLQITTPIQLEAPHTRLNAAHIHVTTSPQDLFWPDAACLSHAMIGFRLYSRPSALICACYAAKLIFLQCKDARDLHALTCEQQSVQVFAVEHKESQAGACRVGSSVSQVCW